MFPAQNVGAVVRRRRNDDTYESVPRAESVGGTYHNLTITSFTFGVRARSVHTRLRCVPHLSCVCACELVTDPRPCPLPPPAR